MSLETLVPGYRPRFVTSLDGIHLHHKEALQAVLNQELTKSWALWDREADEWFADAPIVLGFGHDDLEVCCNKLDEVSLSLSTIDRSCSVDWSSGFDLSWRPDALVQTNSCLGQRLSKVEAVEYLFGGDVRSLVTAESPAAETWLLVGVTFSFDGGGTLVVSNGLDENTVSSERLTGPEYRSTPLLASD